MGIVNRPSLVRIIKVLVNCLSKILLQTWINVSDSKEDINFKCKFFTTYQLTGSLAFSVPKQ